MTAITSRRTTSGPTSPSPGDDRAARLRLLFHVLAALTWTGMFSLYVKVWITLHDLTGVLEDSAASVADGEADAPFQYRFAIPELLMWCRRNLDMTVGDAQTVLDLVALALGVAVLTRILRRLDLEMWVLPAALYGSYLGLGLLWWGKFETLTAFAATTVAVSALLGTRGRRGWVVVGVAAVVLAGTRTDLLLALALAFAARWYVAGRHRSDLAATIALVATSVGATLALMAAFPEADYGETALVQVGHNIHPSVVLTVAAFVLPALGPYLLVRSEPAVRQLLAAHRATVVPLLVMVLGELASIAVVGRLDEVRLLFPVAAPLIVVGVLGWRAVLRDHAHELLGVDQPAS